MVAFSLTAQAKSLELVKEMPNINQTTNWMNTTKLSPSKAYQFELNQFPVRKPVEVCRNSSDQSLNLCESALKSEIKGKATEPVKLMLKAAAVEPSESTRLIMVEYAAKLAKSRMTQEAFEKIIDEVI